MHIHAKVHLKNPRTHFRKFMRFCVPSQRMPRKCFLAPRGVTYWFLTKNSLVSHEKFTGSSYNFDAINCIGC